MIAAVIIACEVGFWVLIALGLIARYPLRMRRTGTVLLAATPVVDLVLLAVTVIDLRAGATAGLLHGLAALYLGFSIAYGHQMIRWADLRFAHRFAGGPPPRKLTGRVYATECWKDVARTVLAAAIASGLLALLTALVGDPSRTEALTGLYRILGIVVAVELIWAVSYTIWPRKAPAVAPQQ
ncbi:hypothetical protein GCM10011512_09890 [Tersicoccus solisilvae]|uniref:Integral membrane protein n=1 Tax=Tersicoccus solisilvae TaxID=1882339 RepID=A0ABQ1NXN0_9MICC|nr:hypothetical protein [Tersicoccus solisilvae]GGC85029.1 hypothetical protein GCM10011512_09890 [Tersicoccus solisilvae]